MSSTHLDNASSHTRLPPHLGGLIEADQTTRRGPNRPLPLLPPGPVRNGDLYLVTDGDLSRIAYVAADHEPHDPETGGGVLVALTHPYLEYATEDDRLLEPATSGLPYQLLVQTDLVGVVEPDQITWRPLSRIGDRLTDIPAGPALRGPFDARWQFKLREGSDLRRLTTRHTARVLGLRRR